MTTGLDCADHRYYSSSLGRLMTPDPYVASVDSVTDSSDAQSWNRYVYVENDPVNSIDPQGEFLCDPSYCSGNSGGDSGSGTVTITIISKSKLAPEMFQQQEGGGGTTSKPTKKKPPKCDTPIMSPSILKVFATMGKDLNTDPAFIMALALQESGWNLTHVYQTNPSSNGKPLNNLFGLTNAGGDNLQFDTVAESGAYWEKDWGASLSDQPDTIRGFVSDLVGTPGHMYNTNPDWQVAIQGGTFRNGKTTQGTYKSVLNALKDCDIIF